MMCGKLVWKLVNLALPCVILLFSVSPLGAAYQEPPILPELYITPSSGMPGSMVTINGTGFLNGGFSACSVAITMDTIVIATNVTVASDGTFSTTATVPNLSSGTKTVTATAVGCDKSAWTTFTVIIVIAPKLSVTPSSGTSGSMVTITGKAFTPSSSMYFFAASFPACPVTITMDTIVIASNVTVASDGTFSTIATIPKLPVGAKTVTATSCDKSASTMFTVIMIMPPSTFLKPDLTIFSTNYRFENDGRVLTLSIGIMNQGSGNAPETLVSIRDKDQDFPYITRPVPSLIRGATATVDMQYELVKAQYGKTHTFVFEVDPDNAVNETNEENNHQSMDVLVPAQGGEVPWQWIVPALLAGAAVSAERLINRRRLNQLKKIQVRPQRDIGTQQIESDHPVRLDYEICLKPVLDHGEQTIEAKGPLINDKRRRG